jgi:hypothetical protein
VLSRTLQYWHDQFQYATVAVEGSSGGAYILEKTKPVIKIYGFEDTESIENIMSITERRQILDKLQVNLVVFNNRIEIRYQIPIEAEKSTSVILNLELPKPRSKYRRHNFTQKP